MNLQQPNANEATRTFNRSKNVAPASGICTRCIDGCRGNCEVFKATFRGRELLYPGPFGDVTAGADKNYPIDYSHLNIHGYALGARGLPEGVEGDPDTARFPAVNTETEYGWDLKVKMATPVFTGALGSTEIARKNWEHFAVGAAISGVTIVCGENVCGIDPKLELNKHKKITLAPDMDRRIEAYRRYHRGMGEILIQMNVEDTRLGVAEYISIPGIKYDPEIGIVGMDVCVTLERPGFRIKKRRIKPRKVGKKHRISKEEAMAWAGRALNIKVTEEEE